MATNEDLEKIKAALENFEVTETSNDTVTIDGHDSESFSFHLDDLVLSNTAYTGGNITINTSNSGLNGTTGATGSGYNTGYHTGYGGYNVSTINWASAGAQGSADLQVHGDAEFDGDIKWKGRSLGNLLESIEGRLAILQTPTPEKLAKFEALKKAYEHYKTLERLIGDE